MPASPDDIRPLCPERLNDFLQFFDGPAFADHPRWASCYCQCMLVDHREVRWPERSAEVNRQAACEGIADGRMQGYLAYRDGQVVGWCQAAPRLTLAALHASPDPDAASLGQITCFVDNLRLALEWAIAADAKPGMRLLVSLVLYWNARINPQECDAWLTRLLEQVHTADSLHARALAYHGLILTNLGKFDEARANANQALDLSRSISDQSTEAYSLYIMGVSFWQRGDFEQGVPIMKQSLALYEAVGDKLGQATTLMRLVGSSDYEASKAYMVESIRLQRELGNLSGLAFSLYYLSIFLILHGDFSSPLPMAEEALSIFQRLGNSVGEANALTIYGYLALFRNEYQDSIAYVKKAIELNEKNERRRYTEIELGPFGHWFDLMSDRTGKKVVSAAAWSAGLPIGTTRDVAKRTAMIEVAITAPVVVTALAPDARLPLGLYRMEARRQFLAAFPTRTPKPNFHVPDAFGTLVLDS